MRNYLSNLTGKGKRLMGMLLMVSLSHCLIFLSSCSEEDETVDEYADWQQRNDAFFATLDDSLARSNVQWMKLKSFSKDETTTGAVYDYIYARVLERGTGTESPLYTDSVRVSYKGRLLPVASEPDGLIFDYTYDGNFSWTTTGVRDGLVSVFVDGFTTAMLHMHRGDRWRVYIPYQLGYKSATSGSVPAYSTLIFDVALVDFCHPNESLPKWNARKR